MYMYCIQIYVRNYVQCVQYVRHVLCTMYNMYVCSIALSSLYLVPSIKSTQFWRFGTKAFIPMKGVPFVKKQSMPLWTTKRSEVVKCKYELCDILPMRLWCIIRYKLLFDLLDLALFGTAWLGLARPAGMVRANVTHNSSWLGSAWHSLPQTLLGSAR